MRAFVVSIVLGIAATTAVANGINVVGEVIDSAGKRPVAGISVQLRVSGAVLASTATERSGAFSLRADTLASAVWVYIPQTLDYEAVELPAVTNRTSLSISLEPRRLRLVGTVTDRITRAPVPFIPVTCARGPQVLGTAAADDLGRYEIRLPSGLPTAPQELARLMRELRITTDATRYLPLLGTPVGVDPRDARTLVAPVLLTPRFGLLRVECVQAVGGAVIRQARIRLGGRLGHQWTERICDGGGSIVLELPVWEQSDLPFERNHLRTDYFVACEDAAFHSVLAQRLTIPPGVGPTPGAVVVLSLAPATDREHQSTYSVILLDPAEPVTAAPAR